MPTVLIAGCGYVGVAAAEQFRNEGWNVTAWTRSGKIADRALDIDPRAVDLRDRDDVAKNAFQCDVVIHCASSGGGDANQYRGIYRDGAVNLVAGFPGARILFTSSTSVYAQGDGGWVDENSPAEPVSAKGKVLREAENVVLGAGGIVLRIGGIYGPGRSFFLQTVMSGSAAISNANDRYVNQIHRDDIASAIYFLVRQKTIAPPAIFNVVDDLPAPRQEILNWLSHELQISLSDLAEANVRRRRGSNKRVSNKKLRALGWAPQYPSYREGFLKSVLPPNHSL